MRCIMPHTNLEIRNDGTFAPCCLSTHVYVKDDGTEYNIATDTPESVWNSADRIRHANDVDSYNIPSCNYCWEVEANNGHSKRLFEQNDRGLLVKSTPRSLDIKFNNVCNLKCVMCTPENSSMWYSDFEKLHGYKFNTSKYKWIHNVDVFNTIKPYIQEVELLEFYGGKPLLIKYHYDILNFCVDIGTSKNQKIRTNTNGTVKITDELLDTYSKFKYVGLNWSIDSLVKEEFEYQRFPANFDSVMDNLQYVIRNKPSSLTLSLTYTVNAMSVFNIGDAVKFSKEHDLFLHLNLLVSPDFLKFNILPKDQLHEYLSAIDCTGVKFNGVTLDTIMQYDTADDSEQLARKMKDYLTQLDSIRKTDYTATFPKLKEFLNDY